MGTAADAPRRYRIAEVARLSGFTTSALRFYEEAGVLASPARTPSGYRSYDGRDVERLRLVARAKELGCTLDEIAGLVQAWDVDRCEPVKHRLRALVAEKVAEVDRHVAEQVALAGQLRATAATLAGRPLDGPCDDGCGCAALARAADGPAVACSLGAGDMAARVDEWRAVLTGVRERLPVAGGVRLVFGPDAPVQEIARLAVAEHDCCAFFTFALTVGARGVALEVSAPSEGQGLLGEVFGTAG
jgi:MerR family copper efflux transcriptional regulator